MRFASLDIGSNTTILLIVEKEGKYFKVLFQKIYPTRLAENLKKNFLLSEKALSRLEEAFISVRKYLLEMKVEDINIVATSASRQAKNKNRIFELGKKYNLENLQIISPEREAELSYKGGLFDLDAINNPLVVDIGGASTEFINFNKNISIQLGTVTLTEELSINNILSKKEIEDINFFIQNKLKDIKDFISIRKEAIVCVGGTAFSLGVIEKKISSSHRIHGEKLDLNIVNFYLKEISKLSLKERKNINFLPSYRYDVFLSGLFILKNILLMSEKDIFYISANGLNHGICLEYFEKINQKIFLE